MNKIVQTLKTKTAIATIVTLLLGGATNLVNWRHERFLLGEPPEISIKKAALDKDLLLKILGGLGTASSGLAILFRGVSKKGFSDEIDANNDGIPDRLQGIASQIESLSGIQNIAAAKMDAMASKLNGIPVIPRVIPKPMTPEDQEESAIERQLRINKAAQEAAESKEITSEWDF